VQVHGHLIEYTENPRDLNAVASADFFNTTPKKSQPQKSEKTLDTSRTLPILMSSGSSSYRPWSLPHGLGPPSEKESQEPIRYDTFLPRKFLTSIYDERRFLLVNLLLEGITQYEGGTRCGV
jgi:hypothetical protein